MSAVAEFVGLCPKMYSILEASGGNIRKAKGVQRTVVKKDLCHELYKQCLDEHKEMMHKQIVILSHGHQMGVYQQNKVSLSPLDMKKWIAADGITTRQQQRNFSTSCWASENPIRWQLSARRHDQQLFTNKTAGRPLSEIVQRGLTTLPNHIAHRMFSQRPVTVSCTPTPTLLLPRCI